MNEWLKKIQVGDKVIVSGGGAMSTDYIAEVGRLTKTQIILTESSTKYRRESGRQLGGSCWSTRWLRETNEDKLTKIKDDEETRQAIYYLDDFKWRKLSLESLRAVLKVVKNL